MGSRSMSVKSPSSPSCEPVEARVASLSAQEFYWLGRMALVKDERHFDRYDRVFAEANRTADNAQRYDLYQRCEEIIAAESPIAPIYFYTRNNLRRPEVKGWYGNLLDNHPLKGVYLDPAAAAK